MSIITIEALQRYTVECGRTVTISMTNEELALVIAELSPDENPNGFSVDDVVNYIGGRFVAQGSEGVLDNLSRLEEFMHLLALRASEADVKCAIDLDYQSELNPPYWAICTDASVAT